MSTGSPPPFPPILPVELMDIVSPLKSTEGAVAGTVVGVGILVLLGLVFYYLYVREPSFTKELPKPPPARTEPEDAVAERGSNEQYESAVVRPQEVVADSERR